MRWLIAWLLIGAACTAPLDPAIDGGANTSDAARSDAGAGDQVGPDLSLLDSSALPDAAASEDAAAIHRCVFDHDWVTLRAVNQRRFLRPGAAAVSSAQSSAPALVTATVEQGAVALRALAAGSSQIAIDSSGSASQVAVEVDLLDSVFATAVVAVSYGSGAGFGQENMPAAVLGPPRGGGAAAGSLDVLSLGQGGTITVELGVDAVDGPGADLIVFENPFVGFVETGRVEVSADGQTFVAFACDAASQAGCAGVNPVKASPDNGLDSTDPAVAGGDAFDLAAIGMARVRFVRITDVGGVDTGGGKAGFDLDAVVAVHSVPHAVATLQAPQAMALLVGGSRSPRFDVSAGDRTLYAMPVACSAQPTGLIEVSCGCNLLGLAAGTATVTAQVGEMTQQLIVTVGE